MPIKQPIRDMTRRRKTNGYQRLNKKIVSKYLYGTEEKPTDIATNALIRPENGTTEHTVQLSEHMSGPGRFARASMSSLVDQFFRPHIYEVNGQPLPTLSPGTYSKEQLGNIYSNGYYGIDITQWQYSDDTDDIAERTFLWNSTSLQLTEVEFIVESSGERRIENLNIIPQLSSTHDLQTSLVQMMLGLGYSLRTAYDSVENKTVAIGFAVADISIDEFGEGQFGINLCETGSAAAFSHIWNDGDYVSVPDAPPMLS